MNHNKGVNMNNLIMLSLLSISMFAHAKSEHRHHEAHVHGGGKLNIAFDKLTGQIEFRAAAEGILGFEHIAKSDVDQKILADAKLKFESNIAKMIQFESVSGCIINKEKIEMVSEKIEKKHKKSKKQSQHSDFMATFKVICNKSILGTKITFDFTSFKKIQDLDVTLLVDTLQKTVEIKDQPVTVDLK